MRYFTVDAFAASPFGGNPAGVVLLDNGASFPHTSTMIQVAAELRYSETAFVQQNSPEEFTVRYFTPAAEVELCGHATIASFSVLRDEGVIPIGTRCINHTLAGDLEVIVGKEIMMQMATPQIIGPIEDTSRICTIMGVAGMEITLPVQIVSTGLPDIILPVVDLATLQALAPDMQALSAMSAELNVVGVHAFALSNDGYTAHVRNFAPLYDIPEESATGTANAALTYYLYNNGLLQPGAKCAFMQGEAMKRPSVVSTELKPDCSVYVGGNSYILVKGEMFL